MPRETINYANTIIYKIVCKDLTITDVYVGHTTSFTHRKREHKSRCNNKYPFLIYKTINDNGGWDNWEMIEIEKYCCNDVNEAKARERYWYEELNAKLNAKCPTENIDMRKKKAKIYLKKYNENLTEIQKSKKYKTGQEWKKQIYICECGQTIKNGSKSIHFKSQNHQDWFNKK